MDETSPTGDASGEEHPPRATTDENAASLADAMLDRLNHDLRSPLGAVLMWVRVMRGDAAPGTEASTALDMIERSAASMVARLDDLAALRTAISGDVPATREPVDVAALAASAAEAAGPDAADREVTLDVSPSPGAACVPASRPRLRLAVDHALASLLVDAPRGAGLEVGVERTADAVECRLVVRPAPAAASKRSQLHARIAQRLIELEGGRVLRSGGELTMTLRA